MKTDNPFSSLTDIPSPSGLITVEHLRAFGESLLKALFSQASSPAAPTQVNDDTFVCVSELVRRSGLSRERVCRILRDMPSIRRVSAAGSNTVYSSKDFMQTLQKICANK